MKTSGKEESSGNMGTVEGKKQEKRRALLEAAYDLFLERGAAKTSVEDITSRAKVAKGTFYLYFQDKGAVMQALLGRVSYQLLSDACEAVEKQTELENFPDKMVAVIDHIIEALRKDTLVLKFLEHNFIWPGLDQIEASREAEPLMRKLLNVVLTSPEMAGRTEREIYQRITALGSMCISVCYTSVLEGKPDNIDNMKPILYDIIRRAELYREDIPDELIFASELVDMEVYADGACIGKIKEVLDYPGNSVYVVQGAREVLIPDRPEFVRSIDPDAGRMVVHLIEGM